jgi:hypothetical protein
VGALGRVIVAVVIVKLAGTELAAVPVFSEVLLP